MTTATFLFQLTNGLVFSLLLFMSAAGLSLIFGLMNVINLAHGSFYLLGGYIGLSIALATGNFWLALLLAPLLVGALGLLIELTLLRRLYARGFLAQVLCTFGLSLIALDLMRWAWGTFPQSISVPALLSGSATLLGVTYPVYRLALIGAGLLIALLLWLTLERTRLGAVVRAGVSDAQMAGGLGINVGLVFAIVFAVGSALAALAGVAAAPIVGIYPGLDADTLILALVVVVVGGLGTLRGAFMGSLLVGMADTFGRALLPQLAVFVIFALMVFVLLVRPAGLFGRPRAA